MPDKVTGVAQEERPAKRFSLRDKRFYLFTKDLDEEIKSTLSIGGDSTPHTVKQVDEPLNIEEDRITRPKTTKSKKRRHR